VDVSRLRAGSILEEPKLYELVLNKSIQCVCSCGDTLRAITPRIVVVYWNKLVALLIGSACIRRRIIYEKQVHIRPKKQTTTWKVVILFYI